MANPYTKVLSMYSPQRTAGIGRKAELPQEYKINRLPYQPQTSPVGQPDLANINQASFVLDNKIKLPSVDNMLWNTDTGGGFGYGGESLEGDNALSLGMVSPAVAKGIETGVASIAGFSPNSKGGYEPSVLGLLGVPFGLANAPNALAKGLAKGVYGSLGSDSESIGMQGGVPAAQAFAKGDVHGQWGNFPSSESISAPSALADIGIGGFPGADTATGDPGGFAIGPLGGGMEAYGGGGPGGFGDLGAAGAAAAGGAGAAAAAGDW